MAVIARLSTAERPFLVSEAAAAGIGDAHLVNKAMLAELDALRATRLTELAEMEEILAELSPLIAEAENA